MDSRGHSQRNVVFPYVAHYAIVVLFFFLGFFPHVASAQETISASLSIADLKAQVVLLQEMLARIKTPTPDFDRSLSPGDEGEDVRNLQQLLNRDPDTRITETGIGSSGQETTFFGTMTHQAVLRFQEKYRTDILMPLGLAYPTGIVGPSTIAKLQTLHSHTTAPVAIPPAEDPAPEEEDDPVPEDEEDTDPVIAHLVTHTSVSSSRVRISWTRIDDAEYTVRRTDDDDTETVARDLTGSSYTDTDITENESYTYTVTARIDGETVARARDIEVTTPSSGGSSAAVVDAPANTVLPAITGTTTSGQTLQTTDGTWDDGGNAISGYTYQWKADGTAIAGATSSTYTLTDTEVGAVITVTVTATNAGGSTAATSAGTDVVVAVLSITATPILAASTSEPYAGFTATASGGETPYIYSLVGTWPDGIVVSSSTGAVSGTPTESGTFTDLSVRVTDNNSDTVDLNSFTLEVEETDEHFASVALLSSFTGSNGSTAFTDQSNNGHTMTAVGNAQIQNNKLELDGSGDRISVPDNTLWTISGDFTLEIFGVEFDTPPGNEVFISHYDGTPSDFRAWEFFYLASGLNQLRFALWPNATAQIASSSLALTAGTPYNFTAERSGTDLRLYSNGVMLSKTTLSGNSRNIAFPLNIGDTNDAALPLDGRMSAVRFTQGVARYASDDGYTVPNLPLPTN